MYSNLLLKTPLRYVMVKAMSANNPFLTAIIISVSIHAIILFQHTNFNFFGKKVSEKQFEIVYVNPPREKASTKAIKRSAIQKNIPLKLPARAELSNIPVSSNREVFKKTAEALQRKPSFVKPVPEKPQVSAYAKKIDFRVTDTDKTNNPLYLSYYQLIREKIRRAAYQNYNRDASGEVYLSFVISQDGSIKDVRIIDEKSSTNPYLKRIALESVQDASPFPAFPKELDYPHLSFNVVVSFELE